MRSLHSSDEVNIQHLRRENEYLKESESRLLSEKQVFDRESHNQHLLLQNLESIKNNLQKSETEGRLRLERSLEEASRECFALRRQLQEEVEAHKNKLLEAEQKCVAVNGALKAKHEELVNLNNEVLLLKDALQQKVRENNDSPGQVSGGTRDSGKELERKLMQQQIEIDSLKKEILLTRDHCKQYCQMAENLEKELKLQTATFADEKQRYITQMSDLTTENDANKQKLVEIEEQIIMQAARPTQSSTKDDVVKMQEEMRDLLEKYKEANKELRYLREQCSDLTTEIQKAEQKYANEMILHSADVQALASLKQEHQKLADEFNTTKLTKDSTNEIFTKKQATWLEVEQHYKSEVENLKLQNANLQKHSEILQSQIKELSNNVSVLSTTRGSSPTSELCESQSVDELRQIIQYLRKEKDIANSKCELIENESARIKLEMELLQKNHHDLQEKLQSERIETDVLISSSSKHAELLRKLEMINAITDSNRVLREERDSISKRLSQTSETLKMVEIKLLPMEEKNHELQSRINVLSNENSSLRVEVTRWRQRANSLVERSSKLDDFKKITTEKDNLLKTVATERETIKRLTDEISSIKYEKSRLENEFSQAKKQHQTLIEENSKELSARQEQFTKLQMELKSLQASFTDKENEVAKLIEKNTATEAELTDMKSKEFQVRRIAKRYKDSYIELKRQVDEKNVEFPITTQQAEPAESDEQVNNLSEENNALKKELELLKLNLEKEERNRSLLREAKQRIIVLQTTIKELQARQFAVETNEQQAVTATESVAADPSKNSLISHLTKENEALSNKVSHLSQLNRQIALQSVKPMPASTSTDKVIDKDLVRTANVKPITPSTTQNTATITSWSSRGSDTPLASIRPMTVQSGRSVAIIPNSGKLKSIIVILKPF